MATWKRFEDMESWQEGCRLACDVYRMTGGGKIAHEYRLRDQVCGSALSIPSNIAEGFERDSLRSFANHVSIAKGSSGELRTQLYIALELGFVEPTQARGLIARSRRISRMLAGLAVHLRKEDAARRRKSNAVKEDPEA